MFKKYLIIIFGIALSSFAFGNDSITFTPKLGDQWTGGYCYYFNISNSTTKQYKGRTVTFDISNPDIYTKWSANFEKTSNGYKLTGLDWNDPIKANQSFDAGFCTNSVDKPYNINFVQGSEIPTNNGSSNPGSSAPVGSSGGNGSSSPTGTSSNGGSSSSTVVQSSSNSSSNGSSSSNDSNNNSVSIVQPSVGAFKAPFYIKEGKILDSENKEVQLRGVNWFGFESAIFAAHGLRTRNYKEMINQMKELGFNAVRLPFCPGVLKEGTVGGVDYSINPDLRGLNSLQLLDKIVTTLAQEGFYVLLDEHNTDCTTNIPQTPITPNYSLDNWINDLSFLAKRYKDIPNVIGIDPKNEPHDSAKWGNGDINTDRKLQVEKAGEAILKNNPNMLIFVEGISTNGGNCEKGDPWAWWGGGFEPLSCFPIDNAKIPANKLVLSPHVYGPDVYVQSYFLSNDFPNNMPKIWDQHFGQWAGKYAIVPGEFGGKYGEGNALDITWQNKIMDYFISKGITSFFYWSRNPNSGDTGGILKDDWKTVNTAKYNNLKRLFTSVINVVSGGTTSGGTSGGGGSSVVVADTGTNNTSTNTGSVNNTGTISTGNNNVQTSTGSLNNTGNATNQTGLIYTGVINTGTGVILTGGLSNLFNDDLTPYYEKIDKYFTYVSVNYNKLNYRPTMVFYKTLIANALTNRENLDNKTLRIFIYVLYKISLLEGY